MSLVHGYSSDEDATTTAAHQDAFNLAAMSSSGRLRVQDTPMNANPQAAPDVLAQVRFLSLITLSLLMRINRQGSTQSNIPYNTPHGHPNECEYPLQ
jgi:hypothetical protein